MQSVPIGVIIVLYFYVRLGTWVARKACANSESNPAKWGIRIAVALVFILIPAGDEIAGRIYFNHLCATEAGAKVYQTIELPAEYWDKNGKAKFIESNGGINWNQLAGVASTSTVTKKVPSMFSITDRRVLVRNSAGEISGEVIIYMFWRGWVIRATTPSNSAVTCDGWRNNQFWSEFYNKLFQKDKASGKG